ncbi:MAG: ATP-binding cassette domain-containing protein, partial [Gaiellaceae bacterium]
MSQAEPLPGAAAAAAPVTETPLLSVKRLSAGYGGPPIIHNVDLTVNPCEVVAVLGPNGSGKSTFLKAIIGQIQASPGSVVEAFGQNVTGWGPQRLASLGVGYVPQHNDAFAPLSV